jgi:glycosyltransferase involved in cell wall biosynthesis
MERRASDYHLAWLSPMPPARTDIAQYSRRVVHHLDKLVPLTVYPEGAVQGAFSGGDGFALAGDAVERIGYSGRLPVINIGNNAQFHRHSVAVARKLPGIVIAHDFGLQNIILAIIQHEFGGAEAYGRIMEGLYGEDGRRAAENVLSGACEPHDVADHFPMIEWVTRKALLLITHNPILVEPLAQRTGRPVAALPLPFEVPDAAPPRQGGGGPVRLVQFGYIGRNRCLANLVKALARQRDPSHFRLDVYGEVEQHDEIRRLIGETGLDGVVGLHGFVDEKVLDQALGSADLVVNLRSPTVGEASGSQLRIFAAGAAGVVVRAGWYDTLPDAAVVKIDPQRIDAELDALLDQLKSNRHLFREAGRIGHAFARREHTPEIYAKRFADLIANMPEIMREAAARDMLELLSRGGAADDMNRALYRRARESLGLATSTSF